MKKAMKVLGILLCAVLLVVGSVAATLAYLTAKTEKITNTFSVGDVEIILTEAKINEDGTPVEGAARLNGSENNDENKYHFMPHIASYTKDPTVTVEAGSDACYVRVMVTVTAESTLESAGTVKTGEGATQGFTYADFTRHIEVNSDWTVQNSEVTATGNSVTYEFRYNTKVESADADQDLTPLFNAIAGVETAEGSKNYLYDGFDGIQNIVVEAHAIQADGFDDAGAAWASFDVNGAAVATK